MKTAWQMEWENEIRYFAPLRAEINTRAKAWAEALEPMRKAAQQFGVSARKAAVSLRKFSEQLDLYSKPPGS